MFVVEFVEHLVALAHTLYFVHTLDQPHSTPPPPPPPPPRVTPSPYNDTCENEPFIATHGNTAYEEYRLRPALQKHVIRLCRPLRPDKGQGWGFLRRCSPFCYFPEFTASPKYLLAIEHHVHIWQVWPQLSCGDTCHICMLHKNLTGTLAGSKILVTEILTNIPGIHISNSQWQYIQHSPESTWF